MSSKKATKQVLKTHYDAQFVALNQHGLGLLNVNQNPIPRPERFVYDEMLPQVAESAREFRTPLPNFINGCKVVLLGCGTGQDAFVLAKLVGEQGSVLAIDPDPAAIAQAQALQATQEEKLGCKLNLEFKQGYPERLDLAGLKDASIDSVVFNLTLNLAYDVEAAIQEMWRVLVEGGEFYGALLTADRRFMRGLLDEPGMIHPVIRGALYLQDFRMMMSRTDWGMFRYMEARRAVASDLVERKLLEEVDMVVRMVRTFKLPLEDMCENYGGSAEYLGTIPGYPQFIDLDMHHRCVVDVPHRMCGNTNLMLSKTRFAPHFRVFGEDQSMHYGKYDYCGYAKGTIHDDCITDYLPEGRDVCSVCQHTGHCNMDGHCQPAPGASPLHDRYAKIHAENKKANSECGFEA